MNITIDYALHANGYSLGLLTRQLTTPVLPLLLGLLRDVSASTHTSSLINLIHGDVGGFFVDLTTSRETLHGTAENLIAQHPMHEYSPPHQPFTLNHWDPPSCLSISDLPIWCIYPYSTLDTTHEYGSTHGPPKTWTLLCSRQVES